MENCCFNSDIICKYLITFRHSGPRNPNWKNVKLLTGSATLFSTSRQKQENRAQPEKKGLCCHSLQYEQVKSIIIELDKNTGFGNITKKEKELSNMNNIMPH